MDKYDDEIAHRKETEERLVKAPDVKTVPVQKPESDPFFEKVAQKIAGNKIIALAEQIKSERAVIAMSQHG
jgi:hypothetical protein